VAFTSHGWQVLYVIKNRVASMPTVLGASCGFTSMASATLFS
jgi:hypothetical protein